MREHDAQSPAPVPRALVIAGAGSGQGKTTVVCALALGWRRRGLRVRCFKVGPDFLDPTHHRSASGAVSWNLDPWLLGDAGLVASFRRGLAGADVAIIEGMMGLFDGRRPDSLDGSTADVARRLGLPVVLVLDAAGMARSAVAVVEGFAHHDPGLDMRGAVFNRLGSARHADLLETALRAGGASEGLASFGWLPRRLDLGVPERHLGLVAALTPDEARADRLAEAALQSIDLDGLHAAAAPVSPSSSPEREPTGHPVRVGLAWDEAFHFVYPDNLELLARAGAEIVRFSPLHDPELPPDLDGLLLPGGYPEVHALRLADNRSMLRSVRSFCRSGRPVLAECGGFLYLGRSLHVDGEDHEFVGFLEHRARLHPKVRTLGYREVTLTRPCILGPAGTTWRGHEFHACELVQTPNDSPVGRWTATWGRPEGEDLWARGGVAGGWVHAHWGSNPEIATHFVDACLLRRRPEASLGP